MVIKIERTLTGFYIEDNGVLAEGFIFIYCSIAIFEFYYINYIPFYYLAVLQVNHAELA